MNTEESKLCFSCIPAGSEAFTRSRSAFTARATASVLALLCLTMPMPTIGTPLPRKLRRFSAAPSCTSATSPRRTRCPSPPLPSTSARKSSAVR